MSELDSVFRNPTPFTLEDAGGPVSRMCLCTSYQTAVIHAVRLYKACIQFKTACTPGWKHNGVEQFIPRLVDLAHDMMVLRIQQEQSPIDKMHSTVFYRAQNLSIPYVKYVQTEEYSTRAMEEYNFLSRAHFDQNKDYLINEMDKHIEALEELGLDVEINHDFFNEEE